MDTTDEQKEEKKDSDCDENLSLFSTDRVLMPNDTISMDNFLSESNIIEPPTAIHLRVGEESTTLSSRCKTSEEA